MSGAIEEDFLADVALEDAPLDEGRRPVQVSPDVSPTPPVDLRDDVEAVGMDPEAELQDRQARVRQAREAELAERTRCEGMNMIISEKEDEDTVNVLVDDPVCCRDVLQNYANTLTTARTTGIQRIMGVMKENNLMVPEGTKEELERKSFLKPAVFNDILRALLIDEAEEDRLRRMGQVELIQLFCKTLEDSNSFKRQTILGEFRNIIVSSVSLAAEKFIFKSLNKLLTESNEPYADVKREYIKALADFYEATYANDMYRNSEAFAATQQNTKICEKKDKKVLQDIDQITDPQTLKEYIEQNSSTLTLSQYFLSNDFSPASYNTGKLLWMGTGTGKTCTALAMMDNFMQAGYTIFWVLPPKTDSYRIPDTLDRSLGNYDMRVQLYRDMLQHICTQGLKSHLYNLLESNDVSAGVVQLVQSIVSVTGSSSANDLQTIMKDLFKKEADGGGGFYRQWRGTNNIPVATNPISYILEFDELSTLFTNVESRSNFALKRMVDALRTNGFARTLIIIDEVDILVREIQGNRRMGSINESVRRSILANMQKYMSQNGQNSLKMIGLSATPASDRSLSGFHTLLSLCNSQTDIVPSAKAIRGVLRTKQSASDPSDDLDDLSAVMLQSVAYVSLDNPAYHGNTIPTKVIGAVVDSEIVLAQKSAVHNSIFSVTSPTEFRQVRRIGGVRVKRMTPEIRSSLIKVGVGINQLVDSKLLPLMNITNPDLASKYGTNTIKLRQFTRVYATKVLSLLKVLRTLNAQGAKKHIIYVHTDEEALVVAGMLRAFGTAMMSAKFSSDRSKFRMSKDHNRRMIAGMPTFAMYGLDYATVKKASGTNELGYPWLSMNSTSNIASESEWNRYMSFVINTYNTHAEAFTTVNTLIITKKNLRGKNFFNTHYFHMLDIPLNDADFTQLIGRVTRMCGNADIGFSKVTLYMYRSLIHEGTSSNNRVVLTINDLLKQTDRKKNDLLNNLIDVVKENNAINVLDDLYKRMSGTFQVAPDLQQDRDMANFNTISNAVVE